MQFQTKPFTSKLAEIPNGSAGIFASLKVMRSLVRQYKSYLPIRTLAVQLVNGHRQKDWNAEVSSLQKFVRDKIRYTRDITDIETIQTPDVTLRLRAGDCDDKSVLLAALLESIGYSTRFVAIGFAPETYEHVLVEVRKKTGWIPLETTEPVGIGWQPINIKAKMVVYN